MAQMTSVGVSEERCLLLLTGEGSLHGEYTEGPAEELEAVWSLRAREKPFCEGMTE